MKVVIPYTDDRLDGAELRYAIRSMCKYFKDMTGCILVGDRPSWYTGEYISCNDIPGRKEYSIYNKLIQVQGVVLYSNDDFFALRPFGSDLHYYYYNNVKNVGARNATYRELYNNCPSHWLNYDIHVPMVIDTTRFEWGAADTPIKSTYANSIGVEGVQLEDMKITGAHTAMGMRMLTDGRPFFSLNGNALYPGIKEFLQQSYPDLSPYEYPGN